MHNTPTEKYFEVIVQFDNPDEDGAGFGLTGK